MIIIKTMTSLPDHCYDCPCHDGDSGYCQADEEHRYSDYRPFWCPLQESKTGEETKIGHCKDCKYFSYENVLTGYGISPIINHNVCSKWGSLLGGCHTKEYGYCFMFESKEEREE